MEFYILFVEYFLTLHKSRPQQLIPYCFHILKVCVDLITSEPKSGPRVVNFLLTAFPVGHKAASWTLCDALWQFGQAIASSPEAFKHLLDFQTTSLHQQGKTTLAIQLFESFISKSKESKDSASESHIPWAATRCSKLYFYQDNFQAARTLTESVSPSALDTLLDYYMILSELDAIEEMKKVEQKAHRLPVQVISNLRGHPMARSRYLMAMNLRFLSASPSFEVDIRVCRTLPNRKEGESESEEAAQRKLSKFSVKAILATTNSGVLLESEPVSQHVDHYNFTLKFPALEKEFLTPKGWTSLQIELYDENNVLFGHHRQFIGYLDCLRF